MKKNILIMLDILIIYNCIIVINNIGAGLIEAFVNGELIYALFIILFTAIALLIGTFEIGLLFRDIKDKLNGAGDKDDI
jgi:hypothetical protein